MFLNLWSKSRCEDVSQDKIHAGPSGPQYLSVKHATPSTHELKRKRDEHSPSLSHLDVPSSKPSCETMSHVEIPSNDQQRAAPSPSFAQAALKISSLSTGSLSQNSVSKQRLPLDGIVGNTTSPLKDTAPKMEGRDPTECQSGQQATRLRSGAELEALRDTIESQFNLEILLKHRELQLIDREIAKCQTGLEQLRRCTIIPYPAMKSSVSNMQIVSDGSGPVYNNSAPQAPAWGITNGPYARHYAQWLIQDPAFDNTTSNELMPASVTQGVGDRTTRGARHERHSVASKSRSSRGINNTRLSSLPDAHPVTKEEKGPCIVVRSSDKKRVKLVCPSCRRFDFNSAQGFINHCRIGHAKAFASHDAAINQCGEEIDEESETGNEAVVSQATTATTGRVHPLVRLAFSPAGLPPQGLPESTQPSKKRKASTLNTDLSPSSLGDSSVPAMSGVSNGSPVPPLKKRKASALNTESSSLEEASPKAIGNIHKAPTQSQETPANIDGTDGPKMPLLPSSETPYLSKLVARLGRGGDLDGMVRQATTKPEIDSEQPSDEEDVADAEPGSIQSEPMARSRSTQGGMRPSSSCHDHTSNSPRLQSHSMDGANDLLRSVEHSKPGARYPSPISMRLEHTNPHPHASLNDITTPLNLSPNSTDPHPAPSLVSDDGDGDFENMHSDSESPSDMGDERAVHHEPHVMDHDGLDLGEGSSLNVGHTKHDPHHDHHGPPPQIVAPTRRSRVPGASAKFNGPENEEESGSQKSSSQQKRSSKAKNSR